MSENLPASQAVQVITPMSLIARAQESNASIEQMQQLFSLQLKWEENEAKKAYFHAVSQFKAEAVDIVKNKKVSYKTDKGVTAYNHAELGQIVNTVTPFLSKYGLSHHWEYSQSENKIKVTCFLTHDMGYEKSTSLEAGADSSGGKNAIQAIGSTTSYLERYTFLAMTGLASRDQDNDGNGVKKEDDVPRITENQYLDFLALVSEIEGKNAEKYETGFCTFHKIGNIAELPLAKYDAAVIALQKRRK